MIPTLLGKAMNEYKRRHCDASKLYNGPSIMSKLEARSMTDIYASSIKIKLYVKARTKPLFYPLPWGIQDSWPLQVQKPHISQEIFGKE